MPAEIINTIVGRLSLRPPQRRSLEILDRVVEIAPPGKKTDLQSALAAIGSEFPGVTDFERDFPSLCFSLATGVGKTRLMGAFISYLHLAHGINHFFVLAPNLTIYDKLIADFTPNTPKYVFRGIAEFAVQPPLLVTGDNYEQGIGIRIGMTPAFADEVHINIFNISKINSEVRGGKSPRIKRLSEYIGQSYFEYLAALPDLVLLMDESHRYRASAGVKAINELQPVLGLELTATPFIGTTTQNRQFFKNVIYDYPLAKAMEDGFVKEPAVVTRKDFNPAGMTEDAVDRLKLEDGIRLHERVKVELETHARETGKAIVKPFVLVVAQQTTHAAELLALIQSADFFEGRYKDKVLQVDSTTKEEEVVRRLLAVESSDEPTEIVIHVNMLQEGWDVTNLYTIIPLRAASAPRLIEQTIGRGLRLPFGHRTGYAPVDRLNIIAHDKFQEIIDEANKPGSTFRLQTVVLEGDGQGLGTATLVCQTNLETGLGLQPDHATATTAIAGQDTAPAFTDPVEQGIAQLAFAEIRGLERQPKEAPTVNHLSKPEIRKKIIAAVREKQNIPQGEFAAVTTPPDIEGIVDKTLQLYLAQTIGIPTILIVPRETTKIHFEPFRIDLESCRFAPVSDEVWIQTLRTHEHETVSLSGNAESTLRPEDILVDGLVSEYDDISYDETADVLYDLASQTVQFYSGYMSAEEAIKVIRCHQRELNALLHNQLLAHTTEETSEYDAVVRRGFSSLLPSAYTMETKEPPANYTKPPADKAHISRLLFGGFSRCLYPVQKFHSDPERQFAVILERDATKWFRPAKGQFHIFYKDGHENREYIPDFVAETDDTILMAEIKADNELDDPLVVVKAAAARKWCELASAHAAENGGKPWQYILLGQSMIKDNMTLQGFLSSR